MPASTLRLTRRDRQRCRDCRRRPILDPIVALAMTAVILRITYARWLTVSGHHTNSREPTLSGLTWARRHQSHTCEIEQSQISETPQPLNGLGAVYAGGHP
jgi:hypothetical protein